MSADPLFPGQPGDPADDPWVDTTGQALFPPSTPSAPLPCSPMTRTADPWSRRR